MYGPSFDCSMHCLPKLHTWIAELVTILEGVEHSTFTGLDYKLPWLSRDLFQILQPNRYLSSNWYKPDLEVPGRIKEFIRNELPPWYYARDRDINDHQTTSAVCRTVQLAFQAIQQTELKAVLQTHLHGTGDKAYELIYLIASPDLAATTIALMGRYVIRDRQFQIIPHHPPAKVRLDRTLIVPLPQAWRTLCLPDNAQSQLFVQRNAERFQKDISRRLNIHTEVQMLAIQEQDPSLKPTLNYFGCSKRSCLLCDAATKLSPDQIRMRGSHGKCYPLWGIPRALQSSQRDEMMFLRDLLVTRIREIGRNGSQVLRAPVSDLDVPRR